jgi:hypothetical protein
MRNNASKFRNESNQRYCKQLFYDVWINLGLEGRTIQPMFTLHQEREGLICFGKEYIKDMDPTGYKTSQRLLEDYSHFKLLLKSPWFRNAKEAWDEEINAKLEAEGLTQIREISRSGEEDGVKAATRLAAAKILLNHGKSSNKVVRKAGRPTAEEVAGEMKNAIKDRTEIEEDAARILEFKKR